MPIMNPMMSLRTLRAPAALVALLSACGTERGSVGQASTGIATMTEAGEATGSEAEPADASDSGSRLDVADGAGEGGGDDDGVRGDQCSRKLDDTDSADPCGERAPPASFDPSIQWAWTGADTFVEIITTPLVANLDDDNGDGVISPCDSPEILAVVGEVPAAQGEFRRVPARLFALHGSDGSELWRSEINVMVDFTPALGDIDGDGLPEIVAAVPDPPAGVAIFEHDGTLKQIGDAIPRGAGSFGSFALADLDADGDVEIYGVGGVFDHEGTLLFAVESARYPTNTAADLDGDGDLEVVSGAYAYHHDGSTYWASSEVRNCVDGNSTAPCAGFPQIANLDPDPEPEVLVTGGAGFFVLEHDGTYKSGPLRPTGVGAIGAYWERPAVIIDFDADGSSDFALSSYDQFATYRADGSLIWTAPVADLSGIASATAFDFLGDGTPEVMYADEEWMRIYDEAGAILLQVERASGTLTEYPVVADVDNDLSAEIVVVSNNTYRTPPQMNNSATLQVVRDVSDRWIQARRIWNQHTYHVTNVNEDSTIPQHETPSWNAFNTFRANAQIDAGRLCRPVPSG